MSKELREAEAAVAAAEAAYAEADAAYRVAADTLPFEETFEAADAADAAYDVLTAAKHHANIVRLSEAHQGIPAESLALASQNID
jgi:uncharacterized protein YdeI (YjbR/CyaY-like superfamily)